MEGGWVANSGRSFLSSFPPLSTDFSISPLNQMRVWSQRWHSFKVTKSNNPDNAIVVDANDYNVDDTEANNDDSLTKNTFVFITQKWPKYKNTKNIL